MHNSECTEALLLWRRLVVSIMHRSGPSVHLSVCPVCHRQDRPCVYTSTARYSRRATSGVFSNRLTRGQHPYAASERFGSSVRRPNTLVWIFFTLFFVLSVVSVLSGVYALNVYNALCTTEDQILILIDSLTRCKMWSMLLVALRIFKYRPSVKSN